MKLISLSIRNFKGIKEFNFTTLGYSVNVFVANGAGKTSLADAWLWLLFGKNTEGATDFGIEPEGSRGQSIETEVIAEIEQPDGTYVLQRTRAENWVKERGSINPTFKGFQTTYKVDGLPVNETNWKQTIAGFIPEQMFKVLSNPEYFARMKWQDARAMLFAMIGEIDDQQIVNADPKLQALNERGRHTVDDWKKVLQADRVRLNKDLELIPIKINEADRAIQPGEVVISEAQRQAAALQQEIDGLRAELTTKPSDAEQRIKQLKNELATLESENRSYIAKQQSDWQQKQQAEVNGLSQRRAGILTQANEQLTFKQSFDFEAKRDRDRATATEKEIKALQEKQWTGATICPTCKRDLPAGDVDAARKAFNAHKAQDVEALEANRKHYLAESARECAELEKAAKLLEDINKQIEAVDKQIRAAQSKTPTFQTWPENEKAQADTKTEIERLSATGEEAFNIRVETQQRVGVLITQKQAEITELNRQINLTENNRRQQERKEELKGQRGTLAAQLEAVEKKINLCEEFAKTKASIIEGQIDGTFDMPGLSFRLFNQNINGGVDPCCEITINGVPYSDANHAARVNAGLAVINAFSKHYGYSAPIWIDEAGEVTHYHQTDAQVIRLYVSEADKALRVDAI